MFCILAATVSVVTFATTSCLPIPALPTGSTATTRAVPHWVKMPLLTPEAKKAGIFPGGEGAQWPRGDIAVSPADPDFLLLPIDVGGLYRSLDGGKHWESAMIGWNARGANAFAIDPRNASHVIGIAGNSMDWNPAWGQTPNGLYLSTNKAASWKQVLGIPEGIGGAVTFDPASFDARKGYCTVAYYLSNTQGLLRSEDGGTTWKTISNGDFMRRKDLDWTHGGTIVPVLCVQPKGGALLIAGASGLYRSTDGGVNFTRLREGEIFGLSLASDGAIFISGAEKILVSHDDARTFTPLACQGLDTLGGKPVLNVHVSPADPKRILCWVSGDNWKWVRYVSQDGGQNFTPATLDSQYEPLPTNSRQGYFAWHPRDPTIAWSLGGDWVTKSTDGGRSFHWSNNGYNGIMLGGLFNFSAQTPNIVFLGFQDYNGAFTTDGGATWNYRDVSGKGWGGHAYGAYAASGQVMFYGDADDWGAPRHLRVSRDGGTTWAFANGPDGKPLVFHGPDVSFGDPSDPQILFASNYRSADGGVIWAAMADCDGVYTASPTTKALLGKKGDALVRSVDKGATWKTVAVVPGGFSDLACDHRTGRLYVASEDRLKVWEGGKWAVLETPKDQYGNSRVWTVATDPQDPAVVYVGGPRNTYASRATVCRSTDGGKTWTNLTMNTPLGNGVVDGPHEVAAIRVHPITRYAWVNGQCFGMWKIAPPAKGERGVSAEQASAPRAVPLLSVRPNTVIVNPEK